MYGTSNNHLPTYSDSTTVLLYRNIRLVEAIRFTMSSVETIITRLGNYFRLLSDGTNVIINVAGSNKALETNPNDDGERPKILVITNPENPDDTTFVTEGQWIIFADDGVRAMNNDEFNYYYRLYEKNGQEYYESLAAEQAADQEASEGVEATAEADATTPAATEETSTSKKRNIKKKKN